jgi:5'-phosphate synthase pdxT subunit
LVVFLRIGVIGVQGDISEHMHIMNKVFIKKNINGKIILIKSKNDIKNIDALIIPGGETTTISSLLQKLGIYNEILIRIKDKSMPIMGTCAGCVLLSNELENESKDIKLLKAMSMKVLRNGFGRQKFSFEKKIYIKNFDEAFNAIFIRAPIVKEIWGDCEIYGEIGNNIVFVKEKIYLALSFHPELTKDLRIHEYFLNIIVDYIK